MQQGNSDYGETLPYMIALQLNWESMALKTQTYWSNLYQSSFFKHLPNEWMSIAFHHRQQLSGSRLFENGEIMTTISRFAITETLYLWISIYRYVSYTVPYWWNLTKTNICLQNVLLLTPTKFHADVTVFSGYICQVSMVYSRKFY